MKEQEKVPILPEHAEPQRREKSRISRSARIFVGLVFLACVARYTHLSCFNPEPFYGQNPAFLIEAENGAVASENERCSLIGVQALKDGGNAVDAAVAATLCSGVVNMFS